MIRSAVSRLALLALSPLAALPGTAAAQSEAAAEPAPAQDYVLPDVPANIFVHETDRFWFRPIIAVVGDYTFFDQDDASLAQVGEQENTRDLRAGRLGVITRSKREFPWEFYFTADYQERRTRDDETFRVYDLRIRLPFKYAKLDIGKMKQPFVYEVVGLSILNPQQERILSPFFVTRSVGILASGQMAGDRMTWAAGWYNDWLETGATFSDNAHDYVARVTGLVRASADNQDYLHVGLSYRRAGPDAGIVRMSGRPETNVSDKYVDTGEFDVDKVAEWGFELVWDRGPFALLAEHVEARAASPSAGDPRFSGNYLTFSWMLTGESRVYDRSRGTGVTITPATHRGAIELVARVSHLDLNDAEIEGGVLDKWHLGANWWSSQQWKAGISYGDADLYRGGTWGNTRMLLLRMQWYY